MKLDDRNALVTGGGSGLGRAIALRVAQEGARVVVTDLRLGTAEQAVSDEARRRRLAVHLDGTFF